VSIVAEPSVTLVLRMPKGLLSDESESRTGSDSEVFGLATLATGEPTSDRGCWLGFPSLMPPHLPAFVVVRLLSSPQTFSRC